jgi:hypothetical protein
VGENRKDHITMANLRSKLYYLLIAALFSMTAITVSQETDGVEDSPVISAAVQSANDGIEYWNAEKIKSGIYCTDETKNICINMEVTCESQIKKWMAELVYQTDLGSRYVVHSPSYWAAKKYLGWAEDALKAVKELYRRTGYEPLRTVISAMETAIEIAKEIIEAFNN